MRPASPGRTPGRPPLMSEFSARGRREGLRRPRPGVATRNHRRRSLARLGARRAAVRGLRLRRRQRPDRRDQPDRRPSKHHRARSGILEPLASWSTELIAARRWSNQLNNPSLRVGMRFDVALGGRERCMSSQQLHVSQRPANGADLPGGVGRRTLPSINGRGIARAISNLYVLAAYNSHAPDGAFVARGLAYRRDRNARR